MSVGQKIRQARTAIGWTQKQLAETVGLTPQAVKDWENGRREPRRNTLARVAKALGRETSWFYEEPEGTLRDAEPAPRHYERELSTLLAAASQASQELKAAHRKLDAALQAARRLLEAENE